MPQSIKKPKVICNYLFNYYLTDLKNGERQNSEMELQNNGIKKQGPGVETPARF